MRARLVGSLMSVVLVAGCSASAAPSPSPSPTPPPSSSPVPTPGPFTLDVFPAEEPAAVRVAIPGSPYVFLVLVTDDTNGDPVTIGASADDAAIQKIVPETLAPGTVGEIWLTADATTVETAGSVTITASRGDATREATRSLPVFPMTDERAKDARPYADRWIAWLAQHHPELGITAATEWQPVFVSTLLVVSHYAYWSEDWELTVAWHNMIAPYDWTEVQLRHRGVDTAPSMAFRIDSVKGATEPHPVEPPDAVVR